MTSTVLPLLAEPPKPPIETFALTVTPLPWRLAVWPLEEPPFPPPPIDWATIALLWIPRVTASIPSCSIYWPTLPPSRIAAGCRPSRTAGVGAQAPLSVRAAESPNLKSQRG